MRSIAIAFACLALVRPAFAQAREPLEAGGDLSTGVAGTVNASVLGSSGRAVSFRGMVPFADRFAIEGLFELPRGNSWQSRGGYGIYVHQRLAWIPSAQSEIFATYGVRGEYVADPYSTLWYWTMLPIFGGG